MLKSYKLLELALLIDMKLFYDFCLPFQWCPLHYVRFLMKLTHTSPVQY